MKKLPREIGRPKRNIKHESAAIAELKEIATVKFC